MDKTETSVEAGVSPGPEASPESEAMAPGLAHQTHIDVRWGDCDAAGIVFYPRYFEWFDHCGHQLLESVGLSHQHIRSTYAVVGTPIVDAGARFSAPATYGDRLDVRSVVTECGRSRFRVTYELTRDGRLICSGHEVRVWAAEHPETPGRLKAEPIPEAVRSLLLGG